LLEVLSDVLHVVIGTETVDAVNVANAVNANDAIAAVNAMNAEMNASFVSDCVKNDANAVRRITAQRCCNRKETPRLGGVFVAYQVSCGKS